MNKVALSLSIGLAAAATSSLANADVVQVTVTGSVEFNQISDPPLGNANSGDPATMTFQVNSNTFTNSPNFPTRGYDIDQSTFSLTLGSTTVGLESPFPAGQTPYFVLRNDDPAVDGFFTSTNLDFPLGVPLEQEGIFGQFIDNFSVTYLGDTLESLDILDALGTYDFTGLTVFNFTIDDGPFNAMGLIFEQMTIESVAECFLVVGDEPGITPWAPNSHVFWPQVSNVLEYYPVTMTDIPQFVLPKPHTNAFAGGTLVTDYSNPFAVQTYTVQVLMYNPDVFPDMPEQYTSGLQAFVLPSGRVLSRPYGDAHNMDISAHVELNGEGQVVLSFPFTIDGM